MNMNRNRALGIAVFMIGLALVYFGLQATSGDLAGLLDGYVDASRSYVFAGMAAIIIGSFVTLFAKQA